MDLKAVTSSTGYLTGKVYLIWKIPHDKITGYEIYRNGNLLVSSLTEDEENKPEFVSPTMFDHDHHTNLFKKDSTHKLMYIDDIATRYQHFEYKVVAKRLNEAGDVMEVIESNTATVEVQ